MADQFKLRQDLKALQKTKINNIFRIGGDQLKCIMDRHNERSMILKARVHHNGMDNQRKKVHALPSKISDAGVHDNYQVKQVLMSNTGNNLENEFSQHPLPFQSTNKPAKDGILFLTGYSYKHNIRSVSNKKVGSTIHFEKKLPHKDENLLRFQGPISHTPLEEEVKYNKIVFTAFKSNLEDPPSNLFYKNRVKYSELKKKAKIEFLAKISMKEDQERYKSVNQYHRANKLNQEQRTIDLRSKLLNFNKLATVKPDHIKYYSINSNHETNIDDIFKTKSRLLEPIIGRIEESIGNISLSERLNKMIVSESFNKSKDNHLLKLAELVDKNKKLFKKRERSHSSEEDNRISRTKFKNPRIEIANSRNKLSMMNRTYSRFENKDANKLRKVKLQVKRRNKSFSDLKINLLNKDRPVMSSQKFNFKNAKLEQLKYLFLSENIQSNDLEKKFEISKYIKKHKISRTKAAEIIGWDLIT